MSNHNDDLYDFYAGLAMLGWIMNGCARNTVPHLAHETAKAMMLVREDIMDEEAELEEHSGGITEIIPPKKRTKPKEKDI